MSDFKDIRDKAFSVSEQYFPSPAKVPSYVPKGQEQAWLDNNGQRDAFRHAYWNALLTKNFGENWTKQFTTAHEGVPGNEADREAMDLYNNEVGRAIATANPNASDAELAKLVSQAVNDGKMVVIDKSGELRWSNEVKVWDHGFADDAPVDGQLHPDADARPDS